MPAEQPDDLTGVQPPGRLLIIGGAEDRCCGAGLLERFVELCGGDEARIVLVTTATGMPDQVHADYQRVFRKLGVDRTIQLRMHGRADADSDGAAAMITDATGVFFCGGDQSRLTSQETTGYPGFAGRLTALLPGLAEHHCAAGRPGGFTDAMARGTYFGHVTEPVALELSRLAGREVHLGRTMWAGADGRYDVMMECPQDEPADSPVAAELLRIAIHAVQEVLAKREPELDAGLPGVSRLVERDRCAASAA